MSTPEDDRRITRLEVQLELLSTQMIANSIKLDKLVEAATMGRGAWGLILRMGTVMVAVVAAVAWTIDRIHWPKGM